MSKKYDELVAQIEALEAELDGMEENLDEMNSEDEDSEISDEDYGIIIHPNGDIKALFMPSDYFEIPETVLKILKVLGVTNPDDMTSHTVH